MQDSVCHRLKRGTAEVLFHGKKPRLVSPPSLGMMGESFILIIKHGPLEFYFLLLNFIH